MKKLTESDVDMEKKGEVFDLIEAGDLEGATKLLQELVG